MGVGGGRRVGGREGWVGGKGPGVKVEGGWSGREKKKTCTFMTVYGHSIQKVCVKT